MLLWEWIAGLFWWTGGCRSLRQKLHEGLLLFCWTGRSLPCYCRRHHNFLTKDTLGQKECFIQFYAFLKNNLPYNYGFIPGRFWNVFACKLVKCWDPLRSCFKSLITKNHAHEGCSYFYFLLHFTVCKSDISGVPPCCFFTFNFISDWFKNKNTFIDLLHLH